MKKLQETATKVFITASVLFGIAGIIAIVSAPDDGDPPSWLMKFIGAMVFTILSSFAVSIALKYLSDK